MLANLPEELKALPIDYVPLRALRKASGLSRAAWCRKVDIIPGSWMKYEQGSPMPLDDFLKVVIRAGVSRRWIYTGVAE